MEKTDQLSNQITATAGMFNGLHEITAMHQLEDKNLSKMKADLSMLNLLMTFR